MYFGCWTAHCLLPTPEPLPLAMSRILYPTHVYSAHWCPLSPAACPRSVRISLELPESSVAETSFVALLFFLFFAACVSS
ncbi:hypothetical protein PISMIDRAFT_688591 [Pisolithus microcarpus 441]|uniref:Uncharacterized protein n=1 Tax=Pisolithus microcarpus 441 TaxID=765257 RepID=A0A0C9YID6_9AGAM|nr:hypothetical protein PISMIDRAFT_688591 [Pisolithus microcarpus 441]